MPPTRGGQPGRPPGAASAMSFNTCPPRGGATRRTYDRKDIYRKVSIHAPHAGGQRRQETIDVATERFQYMPPTRGGNS